MSASEFCHLPEKQQEMLIEKVIFSFPRLAVWISTKRDSLVLTRLRNLESECSSVPAKVPSTPSPSEKKVSYAELRRIRRYAPLPCRGLGDPENQQIKKHSGRKWVVDARGLSLDRKTSRWKRRLATYMLSTVK
ncbi:hypothetical protein R1flu_014063 [Riccia fluitans]|uniref:Uncharacterized protein n=1 Tax=Riccia fluitans TaxID=41844 RepID=A0ABD1YIS3_9MARC